MRKTNIKLWLSYQRMSDNICLSFNKTYLKIEKKNNKSILQAFKVLLNSLSLLINPPKSPSQMMTFLVLVLRIPWLEFTFNKMPLSTASINSNSICCSLSNLTSVIFYLTFQESCCRSNAFSYSSG